jgi:nitric oxide dioxygenase
MTPDQIRLVQASFAPVAALGDAAAMLFYTRLFELDPALRPMFPSAGMEGQSKKLMAMLTVAVHSLTNAGALVPALQSLGRRHAGYGVEPRHYDTVGAALLDTLAAALGEGFDERTRAAWTSAFVLIATTMQDAAAEIRRVA